MEGTLAEDHVRKIQTFHELQEQLPGLKKELARKKDLLREAENHLIEARKCLAEMSCIKRDMLKILQKDEALKTWMLEEMESLESCQTEEQRNIFNMSARVRALQKDHQYHEQEAEKIDKLEGEIRRMSLKICKIENREEEFDYLFKVMDIVRESENIKRAEREGMIETLNEKDMTLPQELKVLYDGPITRDLQLKFVTEEGRDIFKKVYTVTPEMTLDQTKTMFCLLLNEICHMKDTVIENIIKTYGKCYLVHDRYKLRIVEGKTLEETIRYYGIPANGYKFEIFVDYPEEDQLEHQHKKQRASTPQRSRKKLYEKYKQIISDSVNEVPVDRNKCPNCLYDGEMMLDEVEAIRSCPQCGLVVEDHMVGKGMQGVPYGTEMTNMKSKNDYKPIMHLNDILKQKQGIETTVVSDEVIEAVEKERIKHRCPRNKLTHAKIRLWLKKLGKMDKSIRYAKFYEHIPQIIMRLGGPVPVRYTKEQEDAIRWWFNRILVPFEIFRPKEGKHKRKNLFSYAYIIRQICYLIAYYDSKMEHFWLEQAETFALLKDRQKLFVYDKIWSKMMELLGEPFFAAAL